MAKLHFCARVAANRAQPGRARVGVLVQVFDAPLRARQVVARRQRGYNDGAVLVNTSPWRWLNTWPPFDLTHCVASISKAQPRWASRSIQ